MLKGGLTRGNACHAGDLRSGVHEEPASDYEAGEPGDYEAESGCETQLLALGLSLAWGGARLEATVYIKYEKCKEQSTFYPADTIKTA